MLFTDQHVIVLSRDGDELGMGEWSDELDNLARANRGYVVVINSDPPVIYADYRTLLDWYTSDSADQDNHDQEVDLDRIGNPRGASWAYVAPDGRPDHKAWSWAVLDRWLYEDAETLAGGEADGEAEAKAAVKAWVFDEH